MRSHDPDLDLLLALPLPPRLRAIAVQTRAAKGLIVLMACRSRDFPDAIERFEHLAALVDALPSEIDRDAIYQAISVGVMLCDTVEASDPARTRDRDDAHRRWKAATRQLRKVLARHDHDHLVAGLARELDALETLAGDDVRARAELSPTKPGGDRPRALWREHTLGLLRAQRVPVDCAKALLTAADLAGKTPRPRK